jgi:hypothetical protein
MWKSSLLIALSYLLCSALFSWPAVCLDPQILPTRHFDLYPALWLIQESPSVFPKLFHSTSAWPYGESLVRMDSYLLLLIGWLNQNFLSPVQVADLLMWLGPAVNAMAAEHCAHRAFGISRPSSWLAGLSYGFSGIAAVALLEGHVYHLLNPWLPLLLGALWVGTGPDGRPVHGILAGLAWILCQFTTAYLGICGFILTVGLLLRAPRAGLRLWPGLAITTIPAAFYYLWLFSQGGGWKNNAPISEVLQTGSSTLGSLLFASPAIDLGGHSIAAPVTFLSFWLWALSPWILKTHWKGLWALAFFALFCSFGAYFREIPGGPGVASPLAWLALWVPSLSFFRFPIRLLWIFSLISGILGSRVLSERWEGRRLWMGIALLDVWVSSGMPGRLQQGIATVPSGYAATPPDRAVLDVFGEALDPSSGELEMRARALGCYYQSVHRRPILEVCMGTAIESPREQLNRWLMRHLSEKDSDRQNIKKVLEEAGVGAVAIHTDTLRAADAKILSEGLEEMLGAPVSETKDGGERLQIFSLSSAQDDVLRFRKRMKDLDGP